MYALALFLLKNWFLIEKSRFSNRCILQIIEYQLIVKLAKYLVLNGYDKKTFLRKTINTYVIPTFQNLFYLL